MRADPKSLDGLLPESGQISLVNDSITIGDTVVVWPGASQGHPDAATLAEQWSCAAATDLAFDRQARLLAVALPITDIDTLLEGDAGSQRLAAMLRVSTWSLAHLRAAAADGDHDAHLRMPMLIWQRLLLLERAVGHEGREGLLGAMAGRRFELLQAREEWGSLLLALDHPLVRRLPPLIIEAELRRLIERRRFPPVSDRSVGRHDELSQRMIANGLLPRFDLLGVSRRTPVGTAETAALVLVFLVLAGGGLGALGAIAVGIATERAVRISQASLAAFGLVVTVGSVVFPPRWLLPFCLRLAAGPILGLAALIPTGRAWWNAADGRISAAAILASWAYLIIEARNHGVDQWRAIGRSGAVCSLGLLYALLLALAITPSFAPAFTTDPIFSGNRSDVIVAVLNLASVGMALGIFAQSLWEDRPVTYPLTHLRQRDR